MDGGTVFWKVGGVVGWFGDVGGAGVDWCGVILIDDEWKV